MGSKGIGLACARLSDVTWRAGRKGISDEEWTSAFYEEMRAANYTVVGDPDNLFEERKSSEIVLGAKVLDVTHNICYPMPNMWGWGGAMIYTDGVASSTITVEWQVYDPLDKKVLHTQVTKGAASVDFSGDDAEVSLAAAFSNAAKGLLADQKFHQLMLRDDDATPADETFVPGPVTSASPGPVSADNPSMGTVPLAKGGVLSLPEVQKRVVMLQQGSGHGSGFLVGDSGLILTNDHVVKDSKQIRVVYPDGTRVQGRVLKTDPRQDVALVQVDSSSLGGLKVRLEDLPVGSDVYAIGAPYDKNLQGSVSKGVVSNYRVNQKGRWLQSDTTINGGNSGGPLVDAQGRVVGMCSWSVRADDVVGLNFFVPIADALRVMGLSAQ
ncbi:S1C family serine protease [Fundidesulfovibrio magnetotacticus]|uniref:S1C family serine protease n=1 Tax=Fundidesulfovibrio magnetotacticus TaxID=2730080 RepID=UPI001563B80C|nr:S1C family serine protease [Fundidesulfovibrio magnetotacticus]